MKNGTVRHLQLITVAVLASALALPLLVVLPRPAHSVDEFVFQAVLEEKLGTSTNGRLTYMAASSLEGNAPGDELVLSFDESYTRGWEPAVVSIGGTYWIEGSIMTPEVYFGEQYIFYGPPQLYVRQVKTGYLWPDQKTELRALYLSPLSTLAAPIQLPLLFRSDGLSKKTLAVVVLRCVLVVTTLVWTIRRRSARPEVVTALSIYILVAIALSLPILGDLY